MQIHIFYFIIIVNERIIVSNLFPEINTCIRLINLF